METTLYSNPVADRNDSIKKLKSSLTLDLSAKKSQFSFDGILSSPDVRMLKLATPELDRLLLQHQMTNTGASLAGAQIWFPKTVTEEQEAYARGFVDALLELHSKREVAAAAAAAAAAASASNSDSLCMTSRDKRMDMTPAYDVSLDLSKTNAGQFQYTHESAFNSGPPHNFDPPPPPLPPSDGQRVNLTRPASQSQSLFDRGQQWPNQAVRLKPDNNLPIPSAGTMKQQWHGAYTRDYMTSSPPWTTTNCPPPIGLLSDTPPISPIDMVQQEAIKLARKRARNRLAATRCRNRKLERISRLQERVDELKEQNARLTNTATELRETVNRMRQEINAHVNSGCRLLTNEQSLEQSLV